MPREIDQDLLKLFGPTGLEALVKVLFYDLNELRNKVGLSTQTYNSFKDRLLQENSDIIISQE